MMKVFDTKPCIRCEGTTLIRADVDAYYAWMNGEFVQNAFPNWPAEKRELLITGTHPYCWDEMFWDPEEPPSMWLEAVGDPDQWRDPDDFCAGCFGGLHVHDDN